MRDMSRFLASCAFALACLSLGLRIAAPPGFMIAAPDGARSSAIVICTGQGPLTTAPDDPATPPAHDDDCHGPCAFAGMGPALAGQPPALLAEAAYAPAAPPPAPRMVSRLDAGLSAPPPPQTGPPVHA